MVRIRATGGVVTPLQLRKIAELAARYGNGTIHITTRQEFQLHDLDLDAVVPVMRDLLTVGLSSRGGGGNTVRNILVSPGAGVDPDEVFDPSPHAFALTTRLIGEPDSWTLPRKLKIAFSNSPADTAFAQFNDLGFIAQIENGERGYRVFVAGGLGGRPELGHELFAFIPEHDVFLVAEAVKRLFDKHGNRKNRNMARLRFLWRKLGEAEFRALYEREEAAVRAENSLPIMPKARPDHTSTSTVLPQLALGLEFDVWRSRFVEVQRQTDLYSVLLPATLGNLKAADVFRLAQFLEPLGTDVIRASLGQNLRLRNLPEALLGSVFHLVRDFDPLVTGPRFLAHSISCTGADTCKLGICRSKAALTAVAHHLRQSGLPLDGLGEFQLNISGCPNTCGQHMLADLGFYGAVAKKESGGGKQIYPAYSIVAGARIGGNEARLAKSFGRIPARDLPHFVADLLSLWLDKKIHYASFADYVDGEGSADIIALQARYPEAPDFYLNRDYYSDWGGSELFSLTGRGVGECSAGLFDLIDIDLAEAERLREVLLESESEIATAQQLALRVCRALLITRNIQVTDEEAVFAAFLTHFVTAGLIPARFETIVTAAMEHRKAALLAGLSDLFALLDEVKALYTGMDASLRFASELTKTAAE
jgi:sulfite reductase (ferredoxin)